MKSHKFDYTKYLVEAALDSSVAQNYHNIPPSALFKIIRFSPMYDPDLEQCRATISLDAQNSQQIVQSIQQADDQITVIFEKKSGRNALEFSYRCPGMMKAQGMLYPHLKNIFSGQVPKSLNFKEGTLRIQLPSNSTLAICNLFKLCKQLETTRNVKGFTLYAMSDLQSISPEERQEMASHVQQVTESNTTQISLFGPYDNIAEVSQKLGLQLDLDKVDVLDFSKILQQPTMVALLNIVDSAMSNGSGASVDKILEEFRKDPMSSKLMRIIKNNKEFEKQQRKYQQSLANGVQASQPTLQEMDISSIKTLDDLEQMIAASPVNNMNGLPDPDSISNPVARRRLKLFEDAQYYGAQLYYNDDWLLAVCPNVPSSQVWSRSKPKVYATGPHAGEIIPFANLRNDEIDSNQQIPQADKAVYKRIRDMDSNEGSAIIPSTNTTIYWKIICDRIGFDSQLIECKWCTAGAFESRRAWANYTTPPTWWYSYNGIPSSPNGHKNVQNGRRPYWDVMDLHTGKMYQYSNGYSDSSGYIPKILNESDSSENYGGASSMAKGMCEAFPKLNYLIMMTDDIKSESTTQSELKLCDDGSLHVVEKMSWKRIISAAVQNNTNSITIDIRDASNLFKDADVSSISKIIFKNVKNTDGMFQNATLARVLTLCGTRDIVTANSMFQNSIGCQAMSGLDLRSCKSARGCFRGSIGYHNEAMQVQNHMSMPKCEDISYMFFASGFFNIDISDLENVKYATSFCQNSPYLQNVPDLRFPKINSINDLVTSSGELSFGNVEDDPTIIFAGCDYLFSNVDLESEIRTLMKYYDWKDQNSKPEYDENGFLLINNRGDVERFRKFIPQAPGINIMTDNATQLFANMSLNCGYIDMKNVKCADKMFENCQVSHIRGFQNTDQIESAKEMFNNCRITKFPPLSLKGVKYIDGIFKRIQTMQYPQIELGKFVETDMKDETSIFGSKLANSDDIVIRNTIGRVQQWYESQIKVQPLNAAFRSMLENVSTDPNTEQNILHIRSNVDKVVFQQRFLRDLITNKFAEFNIIKIHIGMQNATGIFDQSEISMPDAKIKHQIPPIDLTDVKVANRMFCEMSFTQPLQLIGTNNIESCNKMFYGTRMPILPNMSFNSAVDCSSMFYNAMMAREATYDITSAFPNCMIADSMFSTSLNVLPSTISLDNKFTRLESANSMFESCKYGAQYQNIIISSNVKFDRLERADNMFRYSTMSAPALKIELPAATSVNRILASTAITSGKIAAIDCPLATSAANMCYATKNLKFLGMLNMPSCTNMACAFCDSSLIERIGMYIPNANITTAQDMFRSTPVRLVYGVSGQKFIKFFKTITG